MTAKPMNLSPRMVAALRIMVTDGRVTAGIQPAGVVKRLGVRYVFPNSIKALGIAGLCTVDLADGVTTTTGYPTPWAKEYLPDA